MDPVVRIQTFNEEIAQISEWIKLLNAQLVGFPVARTPEGIPYLLKFRSWSHQCIFQLRIALCRDDENEVTETMAIFEEPTPKGSFQMAAELLKKILIEAGHHDFSFASIPDVERLPTRLRSLDAAIRSHRAIVARWKEDDSKDGKKKG